MTALGPAGGAHRASLPLVLALALVSLPAHAAGWPPVTREELDLARPVVDSLADAEATFWDIRAEDTFNGRGISTEIAHHVRIKVFTERGRESQSRVDLVYSRGQRIDDVSARTVSPDGRVVDLAPSEVYERTLVKASGVKLRAKTFVLPGVERGSIVEYRWHEYRKDDYPYAGSYELQRDIPVQRVTLHLKPPVLEYGSRLVVTRALPLRVRMFNVVTPPLEAEGYGFYTATVNRIPAFVEEPDMPPEYEVRRWMIMDYGGIEWLNMSKWLVETDDELQRAGHDLKRQAAEIVGDAQDPEDRLRRIDGFCRTHIRNLDRKTAGLTEEERSRLRPNRHPRETLAAGEGIGYDIDRLFASLASGAGFDVRWAKLGDRGILFYNQTMPLGLLMSTGVAVRVGDGWRFFDPASPYLRFGTLRWQEEGVPALVEEQGKPLWLNTPLSPSSDSGVERTGAFHLLADGTLVGEARIEFTGHLNAQERGRLDGTSVEEQERVILDRMKEFMPTAEITELRHERLAAPESALVMRYRLRVPGYAKATGTRLFLQPAVFQYGRPPRFAAEARTNPVDLHFPWHEQDSLVIELPAGYELDHPDVPEDLDIEGVCGYRVVLGTTYEGSRVVYRRRLHVDQYYFRRRSYDALKAAFDGIHERDQHALAARPAAASEH